MTTIYIKSGAMAKELNSNNKIDENFLIKGFKKVLLEDKYFDCIFEDFDESLDFNVEKYEARKQKENNAVRIEELDNWFKTDYTTYEQMFVRRKTLGIEDTIVDEFRNKTYHNLIELYEEAEVVAKEIRELRK